MLIYDKQFENKSDLNCTKYYFHKRLDLMSVVFKGKLLLS